MRQSRLTALLNRKDFSNTHYIDAALEYNDDYDAPHEQTVMDESFREKDADKIREVRNQIKQMLNGHIPEKYVTVCYEMDGFRLCRVEAVMSSAYLDVIERDDWSDIIGVDYLDVIETKSIREDDVPELKVRLKPKYSAQNQKIDLPISTKPDATQTQQSE